MRDGDDIARSGFRDQALVLIHRGLTTGNWTSVVYDPPGEEKVDLRWNLVGERTVVHQVKSYQSAISPGQAKEWCDGLSEVEADEKAILFVGAKVSPTVLDAGGYHRVAFTQLASAIQHLVDGVMLALTPVSVPGVTRAVLRDAISEAVSRVEGGGSGSEWTPPQLRALLDGEVRAAAERARGRVREIDVTLQRVVLVRGDDTVVELASYKLINRTEEPCQLAHRFIWRESTLVRVLHASVDGGHALGRVESTPDQDPFILYIQTPVLVPPGGVVTFHAIVRRYGVVKTLAAGRKCWLDPLKRTDPPHSVRVIVLCEHAQSFEEVNPAPLALDGGVPAWCTSTDQERVHTVIWTPTTESGSLLTRLSGLKHVAELFRASGADLEQLGLGES